MGLQSIVKGLDSRTFQQKLQDGSRSRKGYKAEVRWDEGQRAGRKAEGRDDGARQRSGEQKDLREMDRAKESAQTSDGKRLAVRRGAGGGRGAGEGQERAKGRVRVRRARQMAEVRGTERTSPLEL